MFTSGLDTGYKVSVITVYCTHLAKPTLVRSSSLPIPHLRLTHTMLTGFITINLKSPLLLLAISQVNSFHFLRQIFHSSPSLNLLKLLPPQAHLMTLFLISLSQQRQSEEIVHIHTLTTRSVLYVFQCLTVLLSRLSPPFVHWSHLLSLKNITPAASVFFSTGLFVSAFNVL